MNKRQPQAASPSICLSAFIDALDALGPTRIECPGVGKLPEPSGDRAQDQKSKSKSHDVRVRLVLAAEAK
jgi:hypothetical protein